MNLWKRIGRSLAWRVAQRVRSPAALVRLGEPLFWSTGFRPVRRRGCPKPRRILVVKLDRLGDLVLCSPFLHGLRRLFPEAEITLAVRESLAELACLCPDVDSVSGVPVSEGSMIFSSEGCYVRWADQTLVWLRLCRSLRWWSRRFDLAVILRRDADWYGATALAYLSGASRRVAIASAVTELKAQFNRGFDLLVTDAVGDSADRHEVLSAVPLMQAMGGGVEDCQLKPWVSTNTRKTALQILRGSGISDDETPVFVCMGAGESNRRWPPARYSDVCAWLCQRLGQRVVTIGSADEAALGQLLRSRLGTRVVGLEGSISLAVLPAIMERAFLYLGSDTGPMHVAAAAHKPVMMISCHPESGARAADRSPLRFGPWGVRSRILQPKLPTSPCRETCVSNAPHCILDVKVEEVVAALGDLLAEVGLGSGAAAGASVASPPQGEAHWR